MFTQISRKLSILDGCYFSIFERLKVKLNIGDFKEKEEKRSQQKHRNARFGDHERLDRPNPKSFKGKIVVNDSPEDINDIDKDFYA